MKMKQAFVLGVVVNSRLPQQKSLGQLRFKALNQNRLPVMLDSGIELLHGLLIA
jgi:hypothetical protein